jgi:hypothetical protein
MAAMSVSATHNFIYARIHANVIESLLISEPLVHRSYSCHTTMCPASTTESWHTARESNGFESNDQSRGVNEVNPGKTDLAPERFGNATEHVRDAVRRSGSHGQVPRHYPAV